MKIVEVLWLCWSRTSRQALRAHEPRERHSITPFDELS
jgi:hypothetical protein